MTITVNPSPSPSYQYDFMTLCKKWLMTIGFTSLSLLMTRHLFCVTPVMLASDKFIGLFFSSWTFQFYCGWHQHTNPPSWTHQLTQASTCKHTHWNVFRANSGEKSQKLTGGINAVVRNSYDKSCRQIVVFCTYFLVSACGEACLIPKTLRTPGFSSPLSYWLLVNSHFS
jgi:hypothetical protein